VHIGDREYACVASKSCGIFPRDQSVNLRTQQHASAQKSGLRDVKRVDFYLVLAKSGLKNLVKPKILIKKNVRNHMYHQFYLVLAKIQIN